MEESDQEYKTRSISILPPNDQFILMMFSSMTAGPRPTKVEDVTPGYMCEHHSQPVHSFAEKPFTFVCNQCKVEYSEINLQYREIPQIVNHLRNLLTEGKNSLRSKAKVYHSMKVNTLGEAHWLNLGRRVDDYFESLKRSCEDLRIEALDNLSTRKEKIKVLADILCRPINEKLNEMRINIADVKEIQRYSDIELAPKYHDASLLEIASNQDLAHLEQHISGILLRAVDIRPSLQAHSNGSVNISTRPFEQGRSLPI